MIGRRHPLTASRLAIGAVLVRHFAMRC